MCLTGNGTTFALTQISGGATPPTTIGRVLSIAEWGGDLSDIEDSDIETTGLMEYCPGDLLEHDVLTMTVSFDPDVQIPLILTHRGKLFDGTLTFSLPDGQSTPASITGSGYIRGASFSEIQNNQRTEGTVRWRFDNKSTAVAFTASA